MQTPENKMDFNYKDELGKFVDVLMEHKDYETLDEEMREEMKDKLISRAEMYINAEIINTLTPEQIEILNPILEGNDPVKIQEFLHENIPNMESVIAQALIKFGQIYTGN